tara:strand:+ start:109 stop:411 length:303 start_codon:yes stop_codon:yes gene_type:complete
MSRITCTKKNEVPNGPHYVILKFSSVTIPGDERSRKCPGHGYPEHSVSYAVYVAYEDKVEWSKEVEMLTNSKHDSDNFVAFYNPGLAQIKTSVYVETPMN